MDQLDALYDAAISGDAEAIAKLEEKANRLSKKEYTILHTESKNGNADRVRFILKEFANKNLLPKLTKYKHTALHLAIIGKHTEVVDVIIEAARRHFPGTSFQTFLRQGDIDMDTALHAAVMGGNVAIVKLLVEADSTDRHIQNQEGKTPMYLAAELGYNDIVDIISTTCTAPSFQGPDGSIALPINNLDQDVLYDAAIAGDAVAIAKLEMEADKLVAKKYTVLHIESRNGNKKRVQFILREFGKKDLLAKLSPYNETALHWAIYYGHTEVVEVIIEAARKQLSATSFQAFLRQSDTDMETALHAAVKKGNIEIVRLLVEADPTDRHTQNHKGETPMYIAVEKEYNDIVELISTTCTAPSLDGPGGSTAMPINKLDQAKSPGGPLYKILDRDALYAAAIAGDTFSRARLEMKADILNEHGETILHVESNSGKTEHVRFILREFAKKNLLVKLDSLKQTALHFAVYSGQTELAEIIIDAARKNLPETSFQAFLRQSDTEMDTALHAAVMKGYIEIVKLLVEADPTDKHIQNHEGKTPMYIAVEKGYNDIVKVICTTCTAPLNFDGPGGSTALHAAVKINRNNGIEVVEVLIDAARRLLSSDSDSDDTDSSAVNFLQVYSSSDNDSTDDDDDDSSDDDDDDDVDDDEDDDASTDDHSVSSFRGFLRQVDEDLNSALHIAVMQGNLATAKLLIAADPSNPGMHNNKGQTPFYIAVERGYADVIKMHLDEVKCRLISQYGDLDEYIIHKFLVRKVFSQTDEYGQTMLQVAAERNYVEVVELILNIKNQAYMDYWIGDDFISFMPLICKIKEKGYKNIVKLLTERYERGAELSKNPRLQDQARLISAIRRHKSETVLSLLDGSGSQSLVTFVDKLGWTILHYAAYYEFDSIIKPIVEAQKKLGHEFVCKDMVSTPFHVAAERGYTSTVILLMRIWPSSSSVYTNVDKNGQNILHLAALKSKKEMIQGILEYCPTEHKNELVNKQDIDGNTPLHLIIRYGCLVLELLRYQQIDTMVENNKAWSPPNMLYVEDQIVGDQVKIKVALDHIQIDQKKDIFSSSVFSTSKQVMKNLKFKKEAQEMTDEKLARMKGDTRVVAKCYADAISGDPISRAALEMEADTLNEAGETILHVESKKGAIKNVRFIMSAFANKNLLVKLDNQKQTALYLAAHHGHTQLVEALLDAARRNLPSSSANDDTHNPVTPFQAHIRQANVLNQNIALHLAVLRGNMAIVKLLVHADPNDCHVKNNEGKTPIYIAAEKGYKDIVKEICTTCTALSLDGPGGKTTALHALIQNISQVTEGARDVIGMMVFAAKRWSRTSFSKTDESERTVLQLAMERNNVDAVRLILQEDPAYQPGREIKRHGLMLLIFKAIDNGYSEDIVKLLSQTYQIGLSPNYEDVLSLILAIKRRDEDYVLHLLEGSRDLVTFTEDNGWTPLHYAVYHEFDSVLAAIIEAQENVAHQFVYGNMVPTPFHVAVECGYASTLVRLMQSWPALSSASKVDNSPYTVVNKDDQNILHLAAAANRKEMVYAILKYCPEMLKDKILKQQDTNGDTPLHVLISHGYFIPELIKDEGLDSVKKNKKNFTPWEMLYLKNDVVADQVHIKIAIDDVLTNQSTWNLWAKRTEKRKDMWKNIPESKRRVKDVIFEEREKLLMDAKHEERKRKLERYKMRTNTQIIVTALITTVTFTVGFTMPGGLRQSGEVDEGLVLLSKKTAFNAFMVSDALALLLSTSSLFFYFLESMNEDPHQVSKLNAASTVLNIVSVVAMMLTFIAGTYLVLSHSPALAITVCIIGSLLFLLIIILLIKIVYDRLHVKRNLD